MFLKEVEKAKAAGYECSSFEINPAESEESIRQIKEMLQSRHCDLFIVGFGLRGNPVC
jgi:molybdopterin biosynthesis enzyme MoaB